MITPQAIREKTFEKAVFGGYDMASVDSFLEELINDFTTLQKENAVLKAKMKVLVDKVEEYRGNEDALRMAILSAQKLGNMIEAEAKQKAEKMIADAKTEAAKLTREANLEVEVEQARLAESRNASAKFIDSMDMLCRRQLDFLKKIGEMDFVQQLRTEPAAAPAAQPAQTAPDPRDGQEHRGDRGEGHGRAERHREARHRAHRGGRRAPDPRLRHRFRPRGRHRQDHPVLAGRLPQIISAQNSGAGLYPAPIDVYMETEEKWQKTLTTP